MTGIVKVHDVEGALVTLTLDMGSTGLLDSAHCVASESFTTRVGPQAPYRNASADSNLAASPHGPQWH